MHDDNGFSISDLSIEDLKKNLEVSNEQLLQSLKDRFTQNLLNSMIFFTFNQFCKEREKSNNEFGNQVDKSISDIFFSHWFSSMKKQSKKEMLDVNRKLKNEKLNYLSAISDFSLPSTEDYQLIYNEALQDIKNFFEKNTKN
jgi:hypothetical protein